MRRFHRLLLWAVAGILLPCTPSRAATNTVASLADSGAGSLRQAIANSTPGDTIDFSVGGTIVLTTGELAITNNLTITGPGAASLAISGNHTSRVFGVSNVTVNISGITIRDGRAPDGANGVDGVGSAGENGGGGGGIYNLGSLTLSNCVVIGCRSGNGGNGGSIPSSGVAGPAGVGGYGGGLDSHNALTVFGCSIVANTNGWGGNGGSGTNSSAYGRNGGMGGSGGGIFCGGSLAMTSCTVCSNQTGAGGNGGNGSMVDYTVAGNGGTGGNGGGIDVDGGGGTLVACTVVGNRCGRGGNGGTSRMGANGGHGGYDGIVGWPSALNLRNCLVSRNRGGAGGTRGAPGGSNGADGSDLDTDGTVASGGHNFIGIDASGNFTDGVNGDHISTSDPLVGPLGTYGGATLVLPLLLSSPSVNAGDDALTNAPYSLATDQRGSPRKAGSQVDIGAFEFVAQAPTVNASASNVVVDATNALVSADLFAGVDSGGQSGGAFVEYGLTTNYGLIAISTGFDESYSFLASVHFSSLVPGHVYHYRVVATNASGATFGPDQTFTTAQFFAAGDFNGDGTVGQDEMNSVFGNYWQDNPTEITNALGMGRTKVDLVVDNMTGWDLTVQASTNMTTWSNLPVRAVPVFQFTDPAATGSAIRTYRLSAP